MSNHHTHQYTTLERAFIAIAAFVVFGLVGAVIRALSGTVPLFPPDALIEGVLPIFLGVGAIAGVLALLFPAPLHFILSLIPRGDHDDGPL